MKKGNLVTRARDLAWQLRVREAVGRARVPRNHGGGAKDGGQKGLRLRKDVVLRRRDGHRRHERLAKDAEVGAGGVGLKGAPVGVRLVVGISEALARGRVGLLGNVGREALGVRAKAQGLERVDGGVRLHAQELARALQRRLVVAEVGVQAGDGLVRHAAALARDGGVAILVDWNIVRVGQVGAPVVDLFLSHQDLAVVPV